MTNMSHNGADPTQLPRNKPHMLRHGSVANGGDYGALTRGSDRRQGQAQEKWSSRGLGVRRERLYRGQDCGRRICGS